MLTLFPSEKPEYPEGPPQGDRAEISLRRGKKYVTAVCRLHLSGSVYTGSARVLKSALTDRLTENRLLQRIVRLSFYRAGMRSGVPKPVWGALTGIRPGKIVTAYLEEGMSDGAALSRFCREYDVSREKALLCLHTAKAGLRVKESRRPGDICLYIGIPFCPTRCAYCSFVSQAVEKSMKLVPPFLEALYKDIEATAEAARELGLRVISVYMGGGTPTTLSPGQLDELCGKLAGAFDLTSVRDYTIEAGRPDTITEEKLAVMCRHGVNRVSVNPQTMEDQVLEAIGRRHTAADVVEAIEKVRKFPSLTVNMDLIAGLPGDTPDGFSRTLDRVLSLNPENITVHTLSLKKGSRITSEGASLPPEEDVGVMINCAQEKLRAAGYAPYYLYRQKFMAGGFENVGWAKPGFENLYNICIMEELCTILSMGGGASTKLVSGTGRIERIFAPKYPFEYINSIEKVISDKSKIKEFYNGLQPA